MGGGWVVGVGVEECVVDDISDGEGSLRVMFDAVIWMGRCGGEGSVDGRWICISVLLILSLFLRVLSHDMISYVL